MGIVTIFDDETGEPRAAVSRQETSFILADPGWTAYPVVMPGWRYRMTGGVPVIGWQVTTTSKQPAEDDDRWPDYPATGLHETTRMLPVILDGIAGTPITAHTVKDPSGDIHVWKVFPPGEAPSYEALHKGQENAE